MCCCLKYDILMNIYILHILFINFGKENNKSDEMVAWFWVGSLGSKRRIGGRRRRKKIRRKTKSVTIIFFCLWVGVELFAWDKDTCLETLANNLPMLSTLSFSLNSNLFIYLLFNIYIYV